MQPLISVIMSVYKTPNSWLAQSIESVICQTYRNIEFIIVDDGCLDENRRLLDEFAAKDPRIVLVKNEQNIGLTKSLNKALFFAKGDFVARIDVDDMADPLRFQIQVDAFAKNEKLVLCGTGAQILKNEKKTNLQIPIGSSNFLKSLLIGQNTFVHPSVMMRMSVLKERKILYDEHFKYAQDYDLWCRLSKFGDVLNISDELCIYRVHENQVSKKAEAEQKKFRNEIILNNMKNAALPCDEKALGFYLTVYKHEKRVCSTSTIVKICCRLCLFLIKSYGVGSFNVVRKLLWDSFWMIKHNLCGTHLRYFSKQEQR